MSISPESMERMVMSARVSRAEMYRLVGDLDLVVVVAKIRTGVRDDIPHDVLEISLSLIVVAWWEGENAATEAGLRAVSAATMVNSGNFMVLLLLFWLGSCRPPCMVARRRGRRILLDARR